MPPHLRRIRMSEEIQPVYSDPNNFEMMKAKLPSNIPDYVKKIPTQPAEKMWLKLTAYNALYYALIYGGDLISLVSPLAGKAWNQFVKWRFGYDTKQIPIDLKDLKK